MTFLPLVYLKTKVPIQNMYYNTTGKRDHDLFVDDISSYYRSRIIINAKQKDRVFFRIFKTQIMGSQTSTSNTNTDSTSDTIAMALYDMISSRRFLISVTTASVLFLFILQIGCICLMIQLNWLKVGIFWNKLVFMVHMYYDYTIFIIINSKYYNYEICSSIIWFLV